MVKNIIETGIPKIKQYMSETDRALQASDIAEHLGVTDGTAWSVLDLMYAFGIIQKAKRGTTYYFLKDVYSEEQIKAMLPPKKHPHVPKPRRPRTPRIPRPRGRPRSQTPQPVRYSFKDEYLAALGERASSGDGLSALAFLGLPQEEAAENLTTEPPVVEPDLMVEEKKPEPLIKIRPFGTVGLLPKNVRLLSQAETSYLKKLLKGLGGCEGMERHNTVFSKFSALENGRYGDVFYFSLGANPWNNVRKVTVDPSISDYMALPIIEANRWSSWNDFLTGIKETRIYRKGQYDEMLDEFMESGHKLVEITVENRGTTYVKHMLKKKIEERGIMDQVEASRVDEWIYLEKIE